MIVRLLFGGSRSPWLYLLYVVSALVLVFLIAPILVIVPLSFSYDPYFTFPIRQVSLRWYEALIMSDAWRVATGNSVIVAVCSTTLAAVLGTLASLALARPGLPFRGPIIALITMPMVVPMIVSASALYFAYVPIGLTGNLFGLIVAHATVSVPFVVLTVTATLAGFDHNLLRAAQSLGASPIESFRRITFPIILPGIVYGMIFAFIVSFDDVVIALFLANAEQWTLPRQMWSGLRENIDPTILAAGTLLSLFSIIVQLAADGLREKNLRRRRKRTAP